MAPRDPKRDQLASDLRALAADMVFPEIKEDYTKASSAVKAKMDKSFSIVCKAFVETQEYKSGDRPEKSFTARLYLGCCEIKNYCSFMNTTILIILLQFLTIPFWILCSKKKTNPKGADNKKDTKKPLGKTKSKTGLPQDEPNSNKASEAAAQNPPEDVKDAPDAAPVHVQNGEKLPSETF